MSDQLKDGGPAFPQKEPLTSDHQGMSLRDYFIAHAPAEPQPWFVPVMPDMPKMPPLPMGLCVSEQHEISRATAGTLLARDMRESRVIAWWHQADEQTRQAHIVWHAEHAKQRYIQWPAAWADEMLKARGA